MVDLLESKGSNFAKRCRNQLTIFCSYWDIPYNNYNYSYVSEVVDQYGYTTFSWDRLGVGMSDHGDPLSVIQAPLEVAALAALTNMLRAGSIPGISSKPKNFVHVGQSFGAYNYQIFEQSPKADINQAHNSPTL